MVFSIRILLFSRLNQYTFFFNYVISLLLFELKNWQRIVLGV